MASSVLSKLAKRRNYPVTIDGEEYRVRALTIGEGEDLEALDKTAHARRAGYMIGCGLLTEAGEPAFVRDTGETAQDFADRVALECRSIPQDTLIELFDAIQKIRKTPSPEALRGN